eukprot:TRINITY_DN650_c0_g1_i1.p1 TRINITY_DN650_c0_g1~~TRINITY_DN650_c0_g1_i1.p1  ORF type:complete len:616 (+),score=203.02 TRINITY_DN650_c0_g1_i1:168-2015(+)
MTLLLPSPPEGWTGDAEIVSPLSGFPYKRTIEPAGRAYISLLTRFVDGVYIGELDEDDTEKEQNGAEEGDAQRGEKSSHKSLTKDMDDLYDLLGLSHLRWRATDDDIKASYKKMILIYHPDKMKGASGEEQEYNDEIFKKIQKAYDTLCDLKKRRAYDSTDDFDDSIPSEKAADKHEFFKLFTPYFERNARWSIAQPAPHLGDHSTPYEKVKKFYDFWWDFKSWRDFQADDEHDLEQAESREERRWMERENEKQKVDKRKEERSRLLRLAEMAQRRDPRVKKYEQEQEEAKKSKKKAANAAKRAVIEEAEKAAAAQRLQKEEEEKKAAEEAAKIREQKSKDNKNLGKDRTRLRKICKNLATPPSVDDVEILCTKLNGVQLSDLIKAMQGSDAMDAFFAQLKNFKVEDPAAAAEREKAAAAAAAAAEEEKKESKRKPWTEEELSNLAKGLAKFPGGSAQRWEQIAELVPTRNQREISAKVKEIKEAHFANKGSVAAVNPFDKLKAKVGDVQINSAPSSRDDTGESATASAPSTATTTEESKTTTTTSSTTTAASEEVDVSNWTSEEQKALEVGLKEHNAQQPDRWDKIAATVGTKNKKECIARYKHLVSLLKGGKK